MAEEAYNSRSSFKFFPAIKINKQLFMGSWQSRNFLAAVCSGFTTVPKGCYDENMKDPVFVDKSNTTLWVVLLIIAVIAINVVIYLMCRKYVKKNAEEKLLRDKEFSNKVDLVVSNYMQLKESN